MKADGIDGGAANEIVAYVAKALPEDARFVLLVALPDGTPDGVAIVCVANAPAVMLTSKWLQGVLDDESRAGGTQGAAGDTASPMTAPKGTVPGAG